MLQVALKKNHQAVANDVQIEFSRGSRVVSCVIGNFTIMVTIGRERE